jgi:hypothetical protein
MGKMFDTSVGNAMPSVCFFEMEANLTSYHPPDRHLPADMEPALLRELPLTFSFVKDTFESQTRLKDALCDKAGDGTVWVKLTANETIAMALNEVAVLHRRGFFWHFPNRDRLKGDQHALRADTRSQGTEEAASRAPLPPGSACPDGSPSPRHCSRTCPENTFPPWRMWTSAGASKPASASAPLRTGPVTSSATGS